MGNEMGNRNVSGIQEEEKSYAVEAPENRVEDAVHVIPEAEEEDLREKVADVSSKDPFGGAKPQMGEEKSNAESPAISLQVAVHADGLEAEGHIAAEVKQEESHERVAELSYDGSLGSGVSHGEKLTSDEKEQEGTELKPPQSLEAPSKSNENLAAWEGSEVQTPTPEDTSHPGKPNEYSSKGDVLGTHDSLIQNGEVTSESHNESKSIETDEDPKFDETEHVDVRSEPLVDESSASLRVAEGFLGLSLSCQDTKLQGYQRETAQDLFASVASDTNQDPEKEKEVQEETSHEEDSIYKKTCEEKSEIIDQDEVENNFKEVRTSTSPIDWGKNCNEEMPLKAVLQPGVVDSFEEDFQSQDKSMVVTEDTKFKASGLRRRKNNCDANHIHFSDQAVNQVSTAKSNVPQLEILKNGSDFQKITIENAIGLGSSSHIDKVYQIEESKVNNDGNQVGSIDNYLESFSKELTKETQDTAEGVSEVGIAPTESTVTDKNAEKNKPSNFAAKHIQFSDQEVNQVSTAKSNVPQLEMVTNGSDSQKIIIENAIGLGSSSDIDKVCQIEEPKVKKNENQVGPIDNYLVSFSKELTQETQDTAEGVSEVGLVPTESTVTGKNDEESKPIKKADAIEEDTYTLVLDRDRKETTEGSSLTMSNKQAQGMQSQSPDSSFTSQYNELDEKKNDHVEFRRSPSFDFDLSSGARYEESDQTPLLSNKKTTTRSLSRREDARFQSTILQTVYGQDSSCNEAVLVEEKTIRMERYDDSGNSRATFLNLLKKEKNVNDVVTPEKQQESHVVENKAAEESWTTSSKEVASASSQGSGKRKSRSFLFTTCICCAAAIH